MKPHKRENRAIVVPFASQPQYHELLDDCPLFRQHLLDQYHRHPELFPPDFLQGFHFHGSYRSKKLGLQIRRILMKTSRIAYQVRPSFAMSYMTATTDDVSELLSLRMWSVPYWKLARIGGKSAMHWYRLHLSLGRPSLVGTTIKHKSNLPQSLLADEKHTRWEGDKVFLTTTVAKECILGAAIVDSPSEQDLRGGYEIFEQEVRELDAEYRPKSVTTDGWEPTQKAWKGLFAGILVILCYLHQWLSIKNRCKRSKELLFEVGTRVWEAYRAESKRSFAQQLRRLREWAETEVDNERVKERIIRLCEKKKQYIPAYDVAGSPRTSNGVDRLMDFQDRQLYAMKYLKSNNENGQLYVRAMAAMWNFHEYCPETQRNPEKPSSAFEGINGFRYHEDWLQNFNIASSLQRKFPSHKFRYN